MLPQHYGILRVFPSALVTSPPRKIPIISAPGWQHGTRRVSRTPYRSLSHRRRLTLSQARDYPLRLRATLTKTNSSTRSKVWSCFEAQPTFPLRDQSTAASSGTYEGNEADEAESAPTATPAVKIQEHGPPDPRRKSYGPDELFEAPNDGVSFVTENSASAEEIASQEGGFLDIEESYQISGQGMLEDHTEIISEGTLPEASLVQPTPQPLENYEIPDWADFRGWREWWTQQDVELKAREWHGLMLFYMQHQQDHALSFLVATLMRPLPPPENVNGILNGIARSIEQRYSSLERTNQMSDLRHIMSYIIRLYGSSIVLSQPLIWRVLSHLDNTNRYEFYQTLRNHDVALHPRTLLSFAYHFAGDGSRYRLALDTLTEALENPDFDFPQAAPQRICARLLRRAVDQSVHESFEMISSLKDLGVTFGVRVYNALIATASDRGEYNTAWQIFNLLDEPDLAPDETTYSTLLKMCRRSNDYHAFRRLYTEIRLRSFEPEDLVVGPILATEMLFCVWVYRPVWMERTLKIYRQHFDLTPLSRLGLLRVTDPGEVSHIQYAEPENPVYRLAPRIFGPRPPPTTLALAMVLMGFLRRRDLERELLEKIYANFKAALAIRDPMIVALAENSMTWDSFLLAFGRYKETLHLWSEIMRDMTQPMRFTNTKEFQQQMRDQHGSAELFEEPEAGVQTTPQHQHPASTFFTPTAPFTAVKPSEITWTILLNAFATHDQIDAAEKVLELMKLHGLKPGIVTWNSLIRAWSVAGEKDKVLEGLNTIEKEGLRWDRSTVAAIGRDRARGYSSRVGLGTRAKGGGLPSGPRDEFGTFEYIEPEEESISSFQSAAGR